MLPVVFEEFEMIYTFWLLFSFQKVNFSKNSRFLRACINVSETFFIDFNFDSAFLFQICV